MGFLYEAEITGFLHQESMMQKTRGSVEPLDL